MLIKRRLEKSLFPASAPEFFSLTNTQDSEGDRYPLKIQRLFRPKLPFPYKQPIDYQPDQRCTPTITPLKDLKLHISAYKAQHCNSATIETPKPISKKQRHTESLNRQLIEWEDTDAFNENAFLKDPYRTVFVARLYYALTELDLSRHFAQHGSIESVRIVRNKETGASRGYGFVVFEREADAKNCVRELAATGLALDPPDEHSKPRKILVDMERGRLVRSWTPRRLGGGLGGRHYSLPSASRDASAAASGRRMNLSANPYRTGASSTLFASAGFQKQKRPFPDRYSSQNPKRHASDHPIAHAAASYAPATSTYSLAPARDTSIKDKYAKYLNVGSQAGPSELGRSIRSIRQRD